MSKKAAALARFHIKPSQRAYYFMRAKIATPPKVLVTSVDKFHAARYTAQKLFFSEGWAAWEGCGSPKIFAAAIRELGLKKAWMARHQICYKTPPRPSKRAREEAMVRGAEVSEALAVATAAAEEEDSPKRGKNKRRRRLFTAGEEEEEREPEPILWAPMSSPVPPPSPPPSLTPTPPRGGIRSPGLGGQWESYEEPDWELTLPLEVTEQSTPTAPPPTPEGAELSIHYSGEGFSPEKEPSKKADSPVTKEKSASPNKNRETVITANVNSTQRLFADIEELLGGSSSDSSDEDQEKNEKEREEAEREVMAGGSSWYGRSARSYLQLASRYVIDAQADASNSHSYDSLRPQFDQIRESIRLLGESIHLRLERMWRE